MRFLLLFALAFHMTLGPVCMMHTAYAAEHDHAVAMHEVSMTASDCPDCFTTHEPVSHDSTCASGCVSVQEPDLLTFAPQTLEMPVAIISSDPIVPELEVVLLVSVGENVSPAAISPLQSVVLLL